MADRGGGRKLAVYSLRAGITSRSPVVLDIQGPVELI